MLCWFLLQNNVNQSQVYIYPFPLKSPSHPHLPPSPSSRLSQSTRLSSVCYIYFTQASQVVHMVKNPPAGDSRDVGLIPGWGRSPGVGNGTPLQYSCQQNPMDRGALWATGHGITKSRTHVSTIYVIHGNIYEFFSFQNFYQIISEYTSTVENILLCPSFTSVIHHDFPFTWIKSPSF